MIVQLVSIAVLSFAVVTWYITLLMAFNVIILIFIIILLTNQRRKKNEKMKYNNLVEKVIYNKPVTVVLWKDGTKTISYSHIVSLLVQHIQDLTNRLDRLEYEIHHQ